MPPERELTGTGRESSPSQRGRAGGLAAGLEARAARLRGSTGRPRPSTASTSAGRSAGRLGFDASSRSSRSAVASESRCRNRKAMSAARGELERLVQRDGQQQVLATGESENRRRPRQRRRPLGRRRIGVVVPLEDRRARRACTRSGSASQPSVRVVSSRISQIVVERVAELDPLDRLPGHLGREPLLPAADQPGLEVAAQVRQLVAAGWSGSGGTPGSRDPQDQREDLVLAAPRPAAPRRRGTPRSSRARAPPAAGSAPGRSAGDGRAAGRPSSSGRFRTQRRKIAIAVSEIGRPIARIGNRIEIADGPLSDPCTPITPIRSPISRLPLSPRKMQAGCQL